MSDRAGDWAVDRAEPHLDAVADLAAALRIAVTKLRRRLASERDPDNPLSMGAMAVLIGLHSLGEMTLGELAARERVQPPSMTRIVNVLDESGYVTRRPSDADRRLVYVAITERGADMVLADRARRDVWLDDHLLALTRQERELLRAAVPLLDRIGRA